MEYADFADQFWPIYGDRLYEGADRQVVEEIFTKAAALNDGNEAKILAIGEDQGWRCGVTKLFIKDEARYALEATLNKIKSNKATKLQAVMRGKNDRRVA